MADQSRELSLGLKLLDQCCKRLVEQPAAGGTGQPSSRIKAFTINGCRDPNTRHTIDRNINDGMDVSYTPQRRRHPSTGSCSRSLSVGFGTGALCWDVCGQGLQPVVQVSGGFPRSAFAEQVGIQGGQAAPGGFPRGRGWHRVQNTDREGGGLGVVADGGQQPGRGRAR